MLSLKIQNVAVVLELLSKKQTNEEDKSLLEVCKNVLDDAADQAVDYENAPFDSAAATNVMKGMLS